MVNEDKPRGFMTVKMPFEMWLSLYKEEKAIKIETNSYQEFYDLLISM